MQIFQKWNCAKKLKESDISDFIIMESEYNEDPDKRDYLVDSNFKIESTGMWTSN